VSLIRALLLVFYYHRPHVQLIHCGRC
jgi:hypothetical protein